MILTEMSAAAENGVETLTDPNLGASLRGRRERITRLLRLHHIPDTGRH